MSTLHDVLRPCTGIRYANTALQATTLATQRTGFAERQAAHGDRRVRRLRRAGQQRRHLAVNAIAPGRIETPLSSTSSAAVLEAAVAAIPARRLGTANEIAAAALYLASDAAGYVTGTCLDVNGGVFMG